MSAYIREITLGNSSSHRGIAAGVVWIEGGSCFAVVKSLSFDDFLQ